MTPMQEKGQSMATGAKKIQMLESEGFKTVITILYDLQQNMLKIKGGKFQRHKL